MERLIEFFLGVGFLFHVILLFIFDARAVLSPHLSFFFFFRSLGFKD